MVLLSGLACRGTESGGADRLDQLFSGELEIIDLTHSLSATMPYWPNPDGNPFSHDTLRAHPDGSPAMAAYRTPEHHGTHLDAPVHGAEGQLSVDQLTAVDLFGPLAVIDISGPASTDADYRLTVDDIRAWEQEHGSLPDGAIVLLRTGWSEKWADAGAYRNQDVDGRMHFPGFSEGAARFLVAERSIRGIGIDNFSVDYGLSETFAVHGITHGAGKFHLENVANLHRLPPAGAYLIVAPIKIEGGSGGQVRLFAILP